MKRYSADSMELFKATLAKRFNNNSSRTIFSSNVIWKNTSDFIKEYPVILSTTHSLRSCESSNFMFDYVIVDEASQVDLVTGALALSCAQNAVIVGDVKQLTNVVTPEVAQVANQIKANDFVDNPNLINVAVSRAVDQLIVVVSEGGEEWNGIK